MSWHQDGQIHVTWGPECRVEQIHKQAKEGAVNRVLNLIQKERGIRIVSEPKVSAITFPLDSR